MADVSAIASSQELDAPAFLPVEKLSLTPYSTGAEWFGPIRVLPRAFGLLVRKTGFLQEEIGMENKPATQNIQDTFLNTARKERSNITIYLMSGVKLTGRIRSFDKYSVVLETNNQEQLIFKHAISTVAISKAHGFSEKPRVVSAQASAESEQAPAASGTEG
jgi:host factor-I protein